LIAHRSRPNRQSETTPGPEGLSSRKGAKFTATSQAGRLIMRLAIFSGYPRSLAEARLASMAAMNWAAKARCSSLTGSTG
jgi:hypothetical protein